MRLTISIAALALTAMISSQTSAHSEPEKNRYVSSNGVDSGACDNALRPCQSIIYAVQRAIKGDEVLGSSGNYQINSVEEIVYLWGFVETLQSIDS